MKFECKMPEDIQIGDLIVAYEKGFHRVIKFSEGGSCGTIVHYKRVLDSNGNTSKSGERRCDGSYCKKIDQEYVNKLISERDEAFKKFRDNLLAEIKQNETKTSNT